MWLNSLIGAGAPALPSCSCLALPCALSCRASHAVHARVPCNAGVSSSVHDYRVVLLLKVCRPGKQDAQRGLEEIERAAHRFLTILEHMPIDHGGADIFVAEQFLYGTNVIATFQEMGRKAVRIASLLCVLFPKVSLCTLVPLILREQIR